jgi:hypothetical protein
MTRFICQKFDMYVHDIHLEISISTVYFLLPMDYDISPIKLLAKI